LPVSDPELRHLFLRVHPLVQQNRSGAQSLIELESIRQEIEDLTRCFRMANERMKIPSLAEPDQGVTTGLLTIEIRSFGERLRVDLAQLDQKLGEMAQTMAQGETVCATSSGDVESALRDVETFGTVWALEIELARRQMPELSGTLGSSFQEFTGATKRLRDASQSNGGAVGALAGLRAQITTLQNTITQWLQEDEETEREEIASAPLRGDT
jgi:hypothetical protein